MRKSATRFLGVVLLACCSSAAQATIYPPGPGSTCPDTLKVFNVQNPSASCHPAQGDTCNGVAGIVTGFDKIPTGFAFYLQNHATGANGSPWTGIDIFTEGSNLSATLGLQLGDSVVVYGRTDEFGGGSELRSPNFNFSNPNIIVRKVSSGGLAAVPPFHVTTVGELQQLPTNPNAEQWEGCLVRIPSTMRCVRTSQTGGLGQNNAFLVVDNAGCPSSTPSTSTCDSVYIDGNTLSDPSFAPPPLQTLVTAVQGLYDQRTQGYRIQIRDANDIDVAAPPNLVDAWPVADDTLRLIFDRAVTQETVEATDNYSLASFGTVVSATQVAPNVAHLKISNGLSDGDNESVTANGIVSTSSGLAMPAPQTRNFFNGVMSVSLIQAPDPAALAGAPCDDRSKFSGTGSAPGTRLSFRAIATGAYGNITYMEDAAGGKRSGVAMFAPIVPLIVGHKYLISGAVQEFFEETEGTGNVYLRDEGVATIPAPTTNKDFVKVLSDTSCDAAQNKTTGEDFEGVLVKVIGAKVRDNHAAGESFVILGPPAYTDTIVVQRSATNSFSYQAVKDHIVDVTGILRFPDGGFRLRPRTTTPTSADADIVDHGLNPAGVSDQPAELSFSVFPNPARSSRVHWTLPQAQDIELGVYDLAGRQVSILARGRFEAGTYSRIWDGKAVGGRSLKAGMYFYRLKVGAEIRTLRAVLLN